MFEEAKSKGNAVFSAGDYVAVVKHFTDVVPLSPTQPMFLLNVKFGGLNSGDDMEIPEETSAPQSSASKRKEDKKMEEKVVEPEQMKIMEEATGRKPKAVKEKELGNAAKPQRSFISGTIFTGGFNSVTRGHVIDCSMENNKSLKSGLVCGMKGWDEKTIKEKC
ncbi:hypothetical protein OIU79_012171 [Salix purpurea]|uniref:Uncharacterized protein n=1 Tax=Salix purpurea TaxID=77065 RepID=A0A9Q0Q314_SALPP|nr:hypothetical protein OIU79_012171 [Salix purpurea]